MGKGSDSRCGRVTLKSLLMKGVFLIVIAWYVVGMMLVLPQFPNVSGGEFSNGDTAEILQRIDVALKEIKTLKRNNAEMKRIIEGGSSSGKLVDRRVVPEPDLPDLQIKGGSEPHDTYEDTRRQLELNLKEFWYNIRSKTEHPSEIDFKAVQEIYGLLRVQLETLRKSDGFETFREKETQELSRIVQARIHSLQNPKNCDTAKTLICTLNLGCGFGCQIHHVGYCLVTAYATGRTLILESRGWRYNQGGWENVFLPMSETCTSSVDKNSRGYSNWTGIHSDMQVIVISLPLPKVDFLKPKPSFLPSAIPSDIAERLEKVHGEPHIWWVGQFMKYILRPQPSMQDILDDAKRTSGITSPVVGLHVRRTDKIGTEAAYHGLKEYMSHAEEYFSIREMAGRPVQKRVFIASDDPAVITEAKRAYAEPEWEILGDQSVAQSAALSQRYNGLTGIARDIFLLSECDFIVCTFSSQVCRLAYELMQTKHVDASNKFVSLDDIYYFGGGIGVDEEAIMDHKPRNANELGFRKVDKIHIAGNHWDGMSKGTNLRNNKGGLYPSYKTRYSYSKVNFPEQKWWTSSGAVR